MKMKTQQAGSEAGGFSSPFIHVDEYTLQIKTHLQIAMLLLCAKPMINQKGIINFSSLKNLYDNEMQILSS